MCTAVRIAFVALLTVFVFSGCRSERTGATTPALRDHSWPGLFVDGNWVARNRERLILIDARDAESYARDHVKGAIHLPPEEVEPVLSNGEKGLIAWPQFENLMASCGIGERAMVVVYGDAGGGRAARVVRAFDTYGHVHVALMVDGVGAWRKEGHPMDQVAHRLPRQKYRAKLFLERITNCMEVVDSIEQPKVALLDARAPAASGEMELGRIPSSLSLDFGKHIMEPQSLPAVRQLQESLVRAIGKNRRYLVYGDTGPRASYLYLALRDLGVKSAFYFGGWEEWSANPKLPVKRGGAQPASLERDRQHKNAID